MSEEIEFVKLAKNGDKQAIEGLYTMHFDWLYRFIRAKVDSNEAAEDICADAFVQAFENIAKFRAESTFKTWLYSIARNELKSWYKSRSRKAPLEFEVKAKEDEYDEVKMEENEKLVGVILDELKDNYREVLELRFISNLTIKETAETLGITENNVKVIQNRAIKQAQKKVEALNL